MNETGFLELRQDVPVVAIPVCNEAQNILPCLDALAAQTFRRPYEVLLLLNNCTDGTENVIAGCADAWNFRLRVEQRRLKPDEANAGTARGLAMDCAASLTSGVILTTDADSCVSPNWIAANLDAVQAGSDAVAGRAEIDPADAARLPARLLEDEARVQLLATLLDRIDYLLDPDSGDPWPRHIQHSGASIAVTVDAYRRAGGLPRIPLAEDRVFFKRLRRIGARIRHAPEIVVTVSGRLTGRAKGGMADTIRRRLECADDWLDDCIETAGDRAHRAATRALVRLACTGQPDTATIARLAAAVQLPPDTIRALLGIGSFGAAWDGMEEQSPRLRYRPVPACHLESEIRAALRVLDQLEPALAGRRRPSRARTDASFSANQQAASVNASSPAG